MFFSLKTALVTNFFPKNNIGGRLQTQNCIGGLFWDACKESPLKSNSLLMLPHVAGIRGTTGCRWPARGALPRAGAGWPWPSPAAWTPPPTPPQRRSCATRPPGQQSSSSSATWTSARQGEPRLELSSNLHEFHSVRRGPVLHRVLIDSLLRKCK